MSITFAEKKAVTERIEARLNAAIKALEAKHIAEVRELADTIRNLAIERLGLTAAVAELKENRKQQKALEEREKRLQTILAHAIKMPDQFVGSWFNENFERNLGPYWQDDYQAALKGTEWGARIAQLQREKDNLVDTVLVATSSKQLKDLWTRFNALLEIQPTEMERQALEAPAETGA